MVLWGMKMVEIGKGARSCSWCDAVCLALEFEYLKPCEMLVCSAMDARWLCMVRDAALFVSSMLVLKI